jgi:uncharacterized protein (DUF2141 family)
MRGFLIAATFLSIVLTNGPASAVDVVVQVSTVRGAEGVVRAQVCRSVEWLKPDGCQLEGVSPAVPGTTVVTIHGVPPGVYAVLAWHDRNDNDKVDQNFLGIPQEGVGFSNEPPLGLRGPRFADSAVEIGPDGGVVAIRLKFE